MALDLTTATQLAADYPHRYDFMRKLENHYDSNEIGAVLWGLHRAGTIDASTTDSWWSNMTDATEHYTSADVADLLVRASGQPGMAGLLTNRRGKEGGWNIYAQIFVEKKVTEPGPLLEAWRSVPEPMHTRFGLDLVGHGVLDASELSQQSIQRVAQEAVVEIGSDIADRMVKAWPADVVANALNEAAATPGLEIWSTGYLKYSKALLTADQLAGLVLNIDYRDRVKPMLVVMDERPDGLSEALVKRLASGQAVADFGISVGVGWLARRAGAAGESLPLALAQRFVDEGAKTDIGDALVPMLAGIPMQLREPFVLKRVSEYGSYFELIAAACTPQTAKTGIDSVVVKGRRKGLSSGASVGFAAIGAQFPQLLADAYAEHRKLVNRDIFIEGLAATDDVAFLPVLISALEDKLPSVQDATVKALVSFGAAAVEPTGVALKSRKKDVRVGAARVLVALKDDDRVAALAVAALVKEKVEDVRKLLAPLAGQAPKETPVDKLTQARAALSDEVKEATANALHGLRWGRVSSVELAKKLRDEHGSDAMIIAYDGLFLNGGRTSDKLGLWQNLMRTEPKTTESAELSVRMVAGWPDVGDFDRSQAAHERALNEYYTFLLEHFGELAKPACHTLLSEWDVSGRGRILRLHLDQGWAHEALIKQITPKADDVLVQICLERLDASASRLVTAMLVHKKPAVRLAAATALADQPRVDVLEAVAAAFAKEKNQKAKRALAGAGFAIQSLGEASLASTPQTAAGHAALDARMAAYPGPLPKGVDQSALPKANWCTGEPLSDGAAQWLLSRLGAEGPKHHDALLGALRAHLDKSSAGALLAALNEAFAGEKVARNGWVLFAAAILADDTAMTEFGRGLDEEARNGSSAVAFYQAKILARHASAAALTWLDHWSRKARSQGLKSRAAEALDELAAMRGITRHEIADRVTADHGFGADGTRLFTFGDRTLTLALLSDGTLKITGADGKVIRGLPKARVGENEADTKAQKRDLSALKKQLKQAMKAAVERLQQAMVTGRRFTADTFSGTWGKTPLLLCLGRRVLWGLFDADGALLSLVRVDESASLVDVEDDAVALPSGAVLGVVHALEVDDDQRAAWTAVWSDYQLVPPFEQLGRAVFCTSAADGPKVIERYEKAKIGTLRMRGFLEGAGGWTRGSPQDGGGVLWYTKAFARASVTAEIRLDPGFGIGGWDGDEDQGIPTISFFEGVHRGDVPYSAVPIPPKEADAIVYSEVVGDVERLVAT